MPGYQYSRDDQIRALELIDSVLVQVGHAMDIDRNDFALIRSAIVAEGQGRLHDLSSLAEAVGMPRTTVLNRVNVLVARGLLMEVRRGRRCLILGTEDTVELLRPILEKMIDRTLDYALGIGAPSER